MRQYKGGVFFVDVLGVSALTRKRVTLSESDYSAHGLSNPEHRTEHHLCANLLIKFRSVLNQIQKTRKQVKVAQLSDCAFLWSRDPLQLLNAAREFMWASTRKGLLSRGGIAYGDIIEPDKVNTSIGRFVLGEAATKAVEFEKLGKGCRIFSDVDLPSELSGRYYYRHEPFIGLKNPIDCSTVDEFRWFIFPDEIRKGATLDTNGEIVTTALMELVCMLCHSPQFGWNVASHQGAVQVASSVETLSSCVALFNKQLDYKVSSESLMGNLQSSRGERVLRRRLALVRSEIAAAFATRVA
jgi:hypothetical protein